MKFKTLLLGTAAAFAVAGSAQAADLAVAESVEYVKVCDAYGAGYFYIPGSDVCLKIGGYVQFRTVFRDDVGVNVGDPVDAIPDYLTDWKFNTETSVNVTAKWMTDWGRRLFTSTIARSSTYRRAGLRWITAWCSSTPATSRSAD